MWSILSAGQKRIFPVLLGVVLLNVICLAQEFPTAKPESLGLSSERLDRIGTSPFTPPVSVPVLEEDL